MANLETNYHAHTWADLGVTLKRFYIDDPDEVGTVEYWRAPVNELYKTMPFKVLWDELDIEIWHMDHPDLLSTELNQLDDFDVKKEGYQVAAGLHYGNERIALAVFNDKWRSRWSKLAKEGSDVPIPNPEDPGTPDQDDIDYARSVLSHEIGHWYARESNVFGTAGKTDIQAYLLDLFKEHYDGPDRYTDDNYVEKYAEAFRATLGIEEVRGTFAYKPDVKWEPTKKFYTLMKCTYWLGRNLRNKEIETLSLKDNFVQWKEVRYEKRPTGWLWYTETVKVETWYALTNNWDKFIWKKKSDGSYGWSLV